MSSLEPVVTDPDLIRRISRAEYRAMGNAGLFANERIELLYGQLIVMTPPDSTHEESSWTIAESLRSQLGQRAKVRSGLSFAASDDSEPLPDVLVVPNQAYWDENPQHAFLLVEVSRTSLRKDLGIKARLYGEVAVEEYWVIDVEGACVHVFRGPDGSGGWRSHQVAQRGETLAPAAFPDVVIAVHDVLPPVTRA